MTVLIPPTGQREGRSSLHSLLERMSHWKYSAYPLWGGGEAQVLGAGVSVSEEMYTLSISGSVVPVSSDRSRHASQRAEGAHCPALFPWARPGTQVVFSVGGRYWCARPAATKYQQVGGWTGSGGWTSSVGLAWH